MDFNKFDIIAAALIVLCIVVGFSGAVAASNDQAVWIQSNSSNLAYTFIEATIHVVIKNNNDHAEFFKISQTYTGDGSVSPAVKWEVDSGQTRAVTFTMVVSNSQLPADLVMNSTSANQFWPVIPDQGLTSSWFLPNEIDYLNPNLDLQLWQGHFFFFLKNFNPSGPRVEGLVRAPIVPINSFLTASNPTVDFISNMNPSAQTAAWDVTLLPGQQKAFSYTYQWPTGTTVTPANTQSPSSRINSGALSDPSDPNSTKDPLTVPTKSTGVPFGLFIIGAIVIAAGIVYSKFLR